MAHCPIQCQLHQTEFDFTSQVDLRSRAVTVVSKSSAKNGTVVTPITGMISRLQYHELQMYAK